MTKFEEIQCKIAIAIGQDVDSYINDFTPEMEKAMKLSELGFESSKTVLQDLPKKKVKKSRERALLSDYFKKPVISLKELKAFEKKYQLTTHVAQRYVETIPSENSDEILNYYQEIREEKYNYGMKIRDCYFIPIKNNLLITAPIDMFRKAKNLYEMSPEELEDWKKEDPLVLKRICRFDPKTKENFQTNYYVIVTAWGVEAMLAEEEGLL